MIKVISIALCLVLTASFAAAKNPTTQKPIVKIEYGDKVSDHEMYPVDAAAAQGTTYLAYFTFDVPPTTCVDEGWTSHDMTAQTGDYFHVDDFDACGPGTFGRLYAIEGNQSLWCGACPDPGSEILCGYATLPGYGDDWNQAFCTKNCVFVDSLATLDYLVMWDSEPGYDATTIEYTLCDGDDDDWVTFAGGYDGVGGPAFVSDAVPVEKDSIRIRFRFESDIQWSDEDGQWDSDGAIIIDSLTVRDKNGIVVPTEDFEDEAVGAGVASDWQSCTPPGYGDFAQLVYAIPTTYQNDPVQEDPCVTNFTCMWNFYKGSTFYYTHNSPDPSPQQQVVPYRNRRDQYIYNEVWSPWIPLVGTGATVNLEFDVYRDLSLDACTFYRWHIRSKVGGCATPWDSEGPPGGYIYYGDFKDWFRNAYPVGHLIEPGASHIQIALGVHDLAGMLWICEGQHSHAPLFDNVEVYRVAASGPQFGVEDVDMFQDNFSADGTITGAARADMAQDILPVLGGGNPNILPGDSACITLNDLDVGLGGDAFTGCGPAAYCYISVDGHPGGLTAAEIEAPETRGTCGLRFPHVTSTSAAGRPWHVYRMDSCFAANGELAPDRYCIDFNDNVFTPGDTCWFFFGAKNTSGVSTYYSLPYGWSPSINLVASKPDEFTILPAAGDEPGNFILYVDGMNFRGAQPYFDSAFERLDVTHGKQVDRYDIRGPSTSAGNRPSSRVVDVNQQLIGVYEVIIWNTGDIPNGCFSDGTNDKSDDATMLYNWIHLMPNDGGIYFSGDDIADRWDRLNSPGAIALRSYMSYSVVDRDHAAYGLGANPEVQGVVGGMFSDDSMIAYGGCPLINEFDVLAASPPLSQIEANYTAYPYAGPPTGGAIVSQTTTNTAGHDVTIILSGFSFHEIRNICTYPELARVRHLQSIMNGLHHYTSMGSPVLLNTRRNSLAQNYPNPFNPTTTIKYTIKEQAHVSLKIYNVAGQLVKTLVNEVKRPEDVRPVEWRGVNNTGQSVASGVYFYKLVTKNFTQTKKMVLLK